MSMDNFLNAGNLFPQPGDSIFSKPKQKRDFTSEEREILIKRHFVLGSSTREANLHIGTAEFYIHLTANTDGTYETVGVHRSSMFAATNDDCKTLEEAIDDSFLRAKKMYYTLVRPKLKRKPEKLNGWVLIRALRDGLCKKECPECKGYYDLDGVNVSCQMCGHVLDMDISSVFA